MLSLVFRFKIIVINILYFMCNCFSFVCLSFWDSFIISECNYQIFKKIYLSLTWPGFYVKFEDWIPKFSASSTEHAFISSEVAPLSETLSCYLCQSYTSPCCSLVLFRMQKILYFSSFESTDSLGCSTFDTQNGPFSSTPPSSSQDFLHTTDSQLSCNWIFKSWGLMCFWTYFSFTWLPTCHYSNAWNDYPCRRILWWFQVAVVGRQFDYFFRRDDYQQSKYCYSA